MKADRGFDRWIEIFRGGEQVDSKGRAHDGNRIISRAVETFNPEYHEPPVVVGHPKDNGPAYGWVQDLKESVSNGTATLLAKFKDVVPEFAASAKQGLYKKRSASFYPDGRLRHVGFLGAAPPAVKGLADLKFEENDESFTFDFYDPGLGTIAGIFRRMRDWLIEKEGKDAADNIIPDWDVECIREEANREKTETEPVPNFSGAESIYDNRGGAKKTEEGENMSNFKGKLKNFMTFMGVDMSKVPEDALPDAIPAGAEASTFTEADIEAARKEGAKEERKTADAEFAEKEKKRQRTARVAEISDWCDGLVSEGKILPAWVKLGLKEFCLNLDAEAVVEFSEENKSTGLEWFKKFIIELPKTVEFKEIAGRDADTGTGDAAEKLNTLVKKKMSENKDLDYSAAFSEVQKENPDLATEYQRELS